MPSVVYAQCCVFLIRLSAVRPNVVVRFLIFMLNVVMLSRILLTGILLNTFRPTVILLIVIMLCVIILKVIQLSVILISPILISDILISAILISAILTWPFCRMHSPERHSNNEFSTNCRVTILPTLHRNSCKIITYNWVFLENEVDTCKSNSQLIY
jgi:hypothetical protein